MATNKASKTSKTTIMTFSRLTPKFTKSMSFFSLVYVHTVFSFEVKNTFLIKAAGSSRN